ncbi:MAG: PilZ domain-containing protein [Lachnospiraceae bacterium]|nr:PilZ domain-containing protein [Lachnospiraceae bacterium]
MVNQRSYTRLETDFFANLYESTENKEIPCKVRNISECGICFEIPKDAPYKNRLHKGDGLSFHFVDSFKMNDEMETDVMSEKSIIRHVTEKKDGSTLIGCYLNKEKFRQYFLRRQLHDLYYSA